MPLRSPSSYYYHLSMLLLATSGVDLSYSFVSPTATSTITRTVTRTRTSASTSASTGIRSVQVPTRALGVSLPSTTSLSVATSMPPVKDETDQDDDDDDDEAIPDAVVCARGICVLADEDVAEELCYLDEDEEGNLVGMTCVPAEGVEEERNVFSFDFLWPRVLLLGCSCLYGTNFPLGRIMNDSLPASATTSGRMLLAAAALSPFVLKLKPELRTNALIGGCFCALAYISQSIALVDVPAATVAFLGALVVIITPVTNVIMDKAKLGWKDAPQTWIAAILCIVGVGSLELGGEGGLGDLGIGDFWAVMQAVGFGVAFRFTEKMMGKNPDQALPITGTALGMTAFFSAIWAILDGTGVIGGGGGPGDYGAWLLDESARSQYALPGLFLSGLGTDETLRNVALAATWTGLITTAANRVGETTGLGKMSSSEAAVLLATEPLWAAVFASVLLHETLGPQDILGGALIIAACLTSTLKAETLQNLFGMTIEADAEDDIDGDDIVQNMVQAAIDGGNSDLVDAVSSSSATAPTTGAAATATTQTID